MKLSGAQVVVRVLKEENIRYVIGIPGTHNIELYDAFVDEPEIEPILVTDEQSASFMADGFARATGALAAISLVPGAGLTHALSGIAEAYLDQIPMLVLASGIRRDVDFAYQLHEVDQTSIARPVTKAVFSPRTHQQLHEALRSACGLARLAPAGPVLVELAADLLLFNGSIEPGNSPEPAKDECDSREVEAFVDALSEARSLAIYAGYGCRNQGDLLVELAEKLDAIVYTTISGKGVFPETHPRWAWCVMGKASPPPLQKLEKELDCLLAIGCRFSEVASASFGLSPPENLLHIDVDPRVFNRNFPAKLSWTCDAQSALGAILGSPRLRARDTNHHRLEQLRKAHETLPGRFQKKSDGVSPYVLLTTLQSVFGPSAVYAADSGNGLFLAMEILRLNRSHCFLAPVDYSCMGYAIPAAIGAKLGERKRPSIALVGDGAFLMTGMELITAATHGLGVVAVLLSDGELSQIAQFQRAVFNRSCCTALSPIGYRGFAGAMNVAHLELTSNEQADAVLNQAKRISDENKPVLIEVRVNYSIPTYFSEGAVKTNLQRLPWKDRLRFIARLFERRLLGGISK